MSPSSIAVDKTRYNTQYINYALCFFIFLIVMVYFKTINAYALNIPYKDDYDAILGWLVDYKASDFGGRLKLLFLQHNEHRLLASRLVYATYYTLFGDVNIRSFIFLANIQLIGILAIGMVFIKRFVGGFWAVPAFVLALCLFDVNNFENADFAMAGMQNFGIVWWFMLSLFFYTRPGNKNLVAALLFQALAAFSSGNGMVAGGALFVYCLLSQDRRKAILSGAGMLLFLGLYFIGYQSTGEAMTAGSVYNMAMFFLHMAGAHFSFENGWFCALIMLGILAACLPLRSKFKFKEEALPLIAILVFVIGSVGVTSIFRGATPIVQAYASRYFIYTHLLTAIVFCLLYAKLAGKKSQWPVAIIGIFVLLFTYRSNYDYGIANLELEKNRLQHIEFCYPDVEKARKISEAACAADIYCIKDARFD